MSKAAGRWDDLLVRVASGLVMAIVGALAIWLGGLTFKLLICVVVGVLVWELARMCGAETVSVALGVGAALALCATFLLPSWALIALCAVPFAALPWVRARRPAFVLFAIAIFMSGYGLISLRETQGLSWVIWLVLLVVATDVGGYFGGRILGGPKFWPSLSPKKTWAGIITGWSAAAVVSLIWPPASGMVLTLVALSVALSFVSQLGDIAESALKRRAGVKDSSGVIPGHGGLMDRFDSMLSASLGLFLVQGATGLI